MKIENDKITFDAADVAALSPSTQAALVSFNRTKTVEEAVSKVVNNQISLANRMAVAKLANVLHAADPEVRAQAQAHLDRAHATLRGEAPKGILAKVGSILRGS